MLAWYGIHFIHRSFMYSIRLSNPRSSTWAGALSGALSVR